MNESAQDLFGVLVIRLMVILEADKKGNYREKQVTVARVHCPRKNAEAEFFKFKESNGSKNFHAAFYFESAFIH
jgi:hypothetical protein